MGIPLESTKSSSNNIDEPRLPNTTGKARKTKSSLTSKQSQKKSKILKIFVNVIKINNFLFFYKVNL